MNDDWAPIILTGLFSIVSFLFLILYVDVSNANGVFEPIETITFLLFLASLFAVMVSTCAWENNREEEE